MRFLILTQYFPPEVGAPQVRLAAVARELGRLGHEVEVVTAMPNYPTGRVRPEYRCSLYRKGVWEGHTVHRVWLWASVGTGVSRLVNYLSFALISGIGMARARRPDCLFVESPPLFLGVTAALASRAWRVPFVFNVADLWPDSVRELGIVSNPGLLRLAEWLERWIYARAAFVNAVTEGIRTALIENKGVDPARVLLLPNGVDTELFRPRISDDSLANELGVRGKKVLLYAGTVGVAQGLDTAVAAMGIVAREEPGVVLMLVGDGSDKPRLVQEVERRGLRNVLFLDSRSPEQIARLYSLAYAGFASLKGVNLFDGARPSKVLPAMASGKPVIYSGAGEGAREIIQNGCGLVVPPDDSTALAIAICTLARDPVLAEQLGQKARAYAHRQCGWQRIVEDWAAQVERRVRSRGG